MINKKLVNITSLMFQEIKHRIEESKVVLQPFPHIVIKNLFPLKKLKKLNEVLPNYKDVESTNVFFQSSSETKKIILPESKIFKNLQNKKIFKETKNLFSKIKPVIIKKFKKEIDKNVNVKFINSKIKFNMNFALMRKGYLKSPHIDRRDHLISSIFYPKSEKNKGGNLQLWKLKKKNFFYDVFPSKKNISLAKNFKINQNFCLIFLNVPWAYHSVNKYKGNSDRKYFYIDYDFSLKNSSSLSKNRKKGANLNYLWNMPVKVKSLSRKKIFLTE